MSLTTINISTAIPFNSVNDYSQINDIIKLTSDAMIANGYTLVSDNIGSSTVARLIILSYPDMLYNIKLTAFRNSIYENDFRISVVGIGNTTDIAMYTIAGNNQVASGFQNGTIQILKGPNILLCKFTSSLDSNAHTAFAYLKFTDGLWYFFGHLLDQVSGHNGGILDNTTNTAHITVAPPFYPAFLNGSLAMIPWGVQVDAGVNIWNVFPLAAYAVNPAAMSDWNFYVDPALKNYWKYKNILISDG